MKVLVCGGRYYADSAKVFAVLDALHAEHHLTHVIQGGATGADRIGRAWARKRGVQPVECEALWDFYGKPAGHRRNAAQLELLVDGDLVVAFPGGVGTASMIEKARAAKFDVKVIE